MHNSLPNLLGIKHMYTTTMYDLNVCQYQRKRMTDPGMGKGMLKEDFGCLQICSLYISVFETERWVNTSLALHLMN